ncbi:outer membrane protein [Rhodoferax sp.]|uniref:outer membrane protein n=1 Tax=Rhodoferax sp. TaxID=50421 RepID=UPI002ACE0C30|nr:outer membrane beta-barrel protein [Rhodoferax sp.]MDZ7919959.1 outer membrane beta-barrel protein [Rhodoferax sp.]
MKSTTLALTAAALLATTGATFAQNAQQNFVGPAIGLTVSAIQNKVDYESTIASINGQSTQTNDSEASLIASYGFAMTPDWVGTIGLSYSLKSTDAGSVSYTAGTAQSFSGKFKDHLAISFAPGYRVGPNALVYGKLAYHQLKSEFTDTLSAGGSNTHTGTGIGFGVAFALDSHLELRTEYETVTYSAEKTQLTTGKPKTSGLTVGLLYKF